MKRGGSFFAGLSYQIFGNACLTRGNVQRNGRTLGDVLSRFGICSGYVVYGDSRAVFDICHIGNLEALILKNLPCLILRLVGNVGDGGRSRSCREPYFNHGTFLDGRAAGRILLRECSLVFSRIRILFFLEYQTRSLNQLLGSCRRRLLGNNRNVYALRLIRLLGRPQPCAHSRADKQHCSDNACNNAFFALLLIFLFQTLIRA